MEDSMKEAEIEEQFRLLQQEVALAGEAVDALRRDNRAEIDALRLEVQVLQHCLLLLHPELEGRLATVRAEVLRKVDPEAT
jgi:hypothetical protein